MEIKTTFRFYLTAVTKTNNKDKFCKVSSTIASTQKKPASKTQITTNAGKHMWK